MDEQTVPHQEAGYPTQPTPQPLEPITIETHNEFLDDLKKDVGAILDAVKELTKVTGEIAKQVQMLRKAGKF